jgi:hypothetical protein
MIKSTDDISLNQKLLRKPNTDNKGNLFVTVFAFAPATKTNL